VAKEQPPDELAARAFAIGISGAVTFVIVVFLFVLWGQAS
jgi:hypothetical protein